MNSGRLVTSIFDRIISLLAILSGVVVVFMMLAVVSDVAIRNLLGKTLVWVLAISEYSLLWMTFLATAWLLKKQGHVTVDLLINRLQPRAQAVLNIATSILAAVACLVAAGYTGLITLDYFLTDFHTASRPVVPLAPVYIIMPVGFSLLFIQFLRRAYSFLQGQGTLPGREQEIIEPQD